METKKWNPCCFPVEKGLKAISILQMCRGVFYLSIYGLLLGLIVHLHSNGHIKEDPAGVYGLLLFMMLFDFGQVILSVLLWKGAVQRSHKKCRIWFFGVLVLLIINLILFFSSFATGVEPNPTAITLEVILIMVDIYSLVVVFSFLDELTSDPAAAGYTA